MHSRRYDEPVQAAFPFHRKSHVGMVKHDRQQERKLPRRLRQRSQTDQNDLARAPGQRKQHFAEVKPQGGGGIHIEVGMVDHMEAPQKRTR